MLHSDSKVQQAVKYFTTHHGNEITKLNRKHVEGAFGILVIGLILGSFCFIVELVISKLIPEVIAYTE